MKEIRSGKNVGPLIVRRREPVASHKGRDEGRSINTTLATRTHRQVEVTTERFDVIAG